MDRQIIRTGVDGRRPATGLRSQLKGLKAECPRHMTENLEAALEEVHKWNVTEMLQAKGNSVAEALAVNSRA